MHEIFFSAFQENEMSDLNAAAETNVESPGKQKKPTHQIFPWNLSSSKATPQTPNTQHWGAVTAPQTTPAADTMNNLHLPCPLYSKDLVFDSKVYGTAIENKCWEENWGSPQLYPQ